MNLSGLSTAELAAYVAAELRKNGIEVVVVGGSAVSIHAPAIYSSHDIDFAAITGATRRQFAAAVARLGFRAKGRLFVHPDAEMALDLVADTPFVDKRPIAHFDVVKTRHGSVQVYTLADTVADRVSAFLHWDDRASLALACRVVEHAGNKTTWKAIRSALQELDASAPGANQKLKLAVDEVHAAFSRRRLGR